MPLNNPDVGDSGSLRSHIEVEAFPSFHVQEYSLELYNA